MSSREFLYDGMGQFKNNHVTLFETETKVL